MTVKVNNQIYIKTKMFHLWSWCRSTCKSCRNRLLLLRLQLLLP